MAIQKPELILPDCSQSNRHAKGPDRALLHVVASVAKGGNIASEMGGTVRSDLTADPRTARLAQRVIDLNCDGNVVLSNGVLSAGPPAKVTFYRRPDFWMSSKFAEQGPYEKALELRSLDIDEFVVTHHINVVVMDVEGSELEILQRARLPGVERVFLELHDHLYGLAGVQEITRAMSRKGLIYDPRASSGPCVLYSLDDGKRQFDWEIAHAV